MIDKDGVPVCITGKNPYGMCSCCHSEGIKCCLECKEKADCNIACGWMNKGENENE